MAFQSPKFIYARYFKYLSITCPSSSGITNWRIHDLRRTAKTLMRRAKVDRDTSERVLGHVIEGVEGVYDRHDYIAEKAGALTKLSNLVSRILSQPKSGNRGEGSEA